MLLLVLVGCGGGSGGDAGAAAPAAAASGATASTGVHATAMSVTAEPAGKNCAAGGTRIDSGADTNDSGKLDAAESTATQYVCNGSSGSGGLAALVRITAEPAGTHCAQGGSQVAVGADTNPSGVLDAAEVTATSYICNGAAGAKSHNSLLASTREAAGTNCPYGGTRITSGLDANDSGVLDAAEVASTAYSCNGAPGAAGAAGAAGAGGASGSGGTGLSWLTVTATSAQMGSNLGYLAGNAAQVVLTLPAAPAVGDLVSVIGQGAGGWRIAQNAGQTILTQGLPSTLAAGVVWKPRETAREWYAVASSASGTKLVAAVSNGQLFVSTDAGVTWAARDSARNWRSVASSADGTQLVAAAGGGQIYTSSDGGANWLPRDQARNWIALASSADGVHLLAAVQNGGLYTSADSGATWVPRESSRNWSSVASSSDGSHLAATDSGGLIYTSSDSGATWAPQQSARGWVSIASSADGAKLVAAVTGGALYTSSDFGATWQGRASALSWSSVASSADGTRLVAAEFNGHLWTSTDAGASWTSRETVRGWLAVASSADGSHLLACTLGIVNDTLFTSDNTSTSPGVTGYLAGSQYDSVDLIFLGGGVFYVRNFSTYSGLFSGN